MQPVFEKMKLFDRKDKGRDEDVSKMTRNRGGFRRNFRIRGREQWMQKVIELFKNHPKYPLNMVLLVAVYTKDQPSLLFFAVFQGNVRRDSKNLRTAP